MRQLAVHPCDLDLSDQLASDLLMLPPDALGHAAASVTCLKLPVVLWQLPAFCCGMPALRELHLPHFAGDTLDVKDFHQLERVEGSAGVRLGMVHANACTELKLELTSRLRKVRVQRYVDGQPGRTHALPGHAYTHIAPGADRPDYTSLNGLARFADNNELIVCRHIARHVQEAWPAMRQAGKISAPGFAGIARLADLPTKISSEVQHRFNLDVALSESFAFVDDAGFAAFAAQALDKMMQLARAENLRKTWAGFYIASTNHVMNLMLIAKASTPPVYAAMVVDPNVLLARRRVEANSLAAIQHVTHGWQLSTLIESDALKNYTDPTRPALLCVFSARRRAAQAKSAVITLIRPAQRFNGERYFLMMILGLHAPLAKALGQVVDAYQNSSITGAQAYHALAAQNLKKETGLSFALGMGLSACARLFTDAVERLAATRTAAHLLNYGSGKLPDQWCESLLTTQQSWSEIALSQKPGATAGLAHLVSACQRLFSSGDLSAQACLRFLDRSGDKDHAAWNAIDATVATQNEALLAAFGKLLGALYGSGAVSWSQCETVVKDRPLLCTWLPRPPFLEAGSANDDAPVSFADFLIIPDEH